MLPLVQGEDLPGGFVIMNSIVTTVAIMIIINNMIINTSIPFVWLLLVLSISIIIISSSITIKWSVVGSRRDCSSAADLPAKAIQ